MKKVHQNLSYYKNYGKYPLGLEPESIKNMSEVDLFFLINDIYMLISKINLKPKFDKNYVQKSYMDYAVPNNENFVKLFNFFANQTKKFGIEGVESFSKWMTFYKNHFDNLYINSYKDWQKFQKLRNQGKNYSLYLPKKEIKKGKQVEILSYPDLINAEQLDKLSEVELFFNISDLIIFISKCNQLCDVKTKEILSNILDFNIYRTQSFGVSIAIPAKNHHFSFEYNPLIKNSFFKWYTFFDCHFSNLSKNVKASLLEARKSGDDLSPFLPRSNWLENHKEDEELLCK